MTNLRARAGGCAILVVAVILLPHVVHQFQLYTATLGATYLVAAIGLNVLVGYAGVISLGTSAFAMVGGYTVGIFHAQFGLGLLAGTVVAVVVSTLIGIVTGLPALRLGPFAVAVVTIAYLNVATAVVALTPSISGGLDGITVPSSSLTSGELWYAFAGVAAVVGLLQCSTIRSPFGRALTTSRLSPVLASSLGVSHMRVKLVAFAVSGGLAGLSGAMYPMLNGQVSTSTFDVSLSVLLLLMVVLGGQGTLAGPVVGAIVLTIVPYVLTHVLQANGNQTTLIYGLFLLATVVFFPTGLIGLTSLVTRRLHTTVSAGPGSAAGARPDTQAGGLGTLLESTSGGRLDVESVSKSFGGVSVLTDVSLTVQAGQVHGLIGPNGSGKTTLLNCVSGLTSSSGKFRLDGSPLGRRSEVRARTGIARTFQQPILENASALLENIRVGVDANRHVKAFGYILRLPSARREAVDSRRQAVDWLCTLGLYEDSDKPAGALPPGKQRLLEVGRALATHPRVILLDEPAAGLNQAEIAQLDRTIRAVRDAGISVLLVDHHVDLVLGVCDEITVLANGRVIATGAPEEIRNSAAVLDAYLGRRRERSRVGSRGEPS